jgi:hypothetical protein
MALHMVEEGQELLVILSVIHWGTSMQTLPVLVGELLLLLLMAIYL